MPRWQSHTTVLKQARRTIHLITATHTATHIATHTKHVTTKQAQQAGQRPAKEHALFKANQERHQDYQHGCGSGTCGSM